MQKDRFYIGYLDQNATLQTNLRPYAIADNAFAQLNNAYVFRGRVRKRFGTRFMGQDQLTSRLRMIVDTTDVNGDASNTVSGSVGAIGQIFSIGSTIFTVYQANGALLTTGSGTGTFNTATGAFTFTGADSNTDIYWYPSLPVMALINYESASINDEPLYAFDTAFSYSYNNGWDRLGSATWSGTNSQFHWGATWRGITNYENYLFVVNYNVTDQIKYWDGLAWTTINPVFNASGDTIETAKIVLPFKDRLILLNTIENITGSNRTFVNRCRFSQNGSPVQAGAGVGAWLEDTPGKGGYLDAPTKEAIITAQFLRDRLIVYFEKSTWELVYTGNQILPFVWQQINTELGAESTFSQVPFDKVVIGVGNVGIHACNGSNVERIDDKIPDSVFEINNDNAGVERVYGIRDYYTEMIYWTFPNAVDRSDTVPYPNRVLTYNYKTGSWAFNDDSFTCFGYYQPTQGITWGESIEEWQEAIATWGGSGLDAKFRNVLAGNQEGFTLIVDADTTRNAPALSITNMTIAGINVTITAIDHNLSAGDYVIIENAQGITSLNDQIFQVSSVTDANTFVVLYPAGGIGTYTGGGTIARISVIDIKTKQYNFYVQQGKNAYIQKVDFLIDKTENGQIYVNYSTSSSDRSLVEDAFVTNAVLGDSVLETSPYALIPYEQTQSRLWHSLYLQGDGECIQLQLTYNAEQVVDPDIVWSDFQLHAMIFYAQPVGRLQ